MICEHLGNLRRLPVSGVYHVGAPDSGRGSSNAGAEDAEQVADALQSFLELVDSDARRCQSLPRSPTKRRYDTGQETGHKISRLLKKAEDAISREDDQPDERHRSRSHGFDAPDVICGESGARRGHNKDSQQDGSDHSRFMPRMLSRRGTEQAYSTRVSVQTVPCSTGPLTLRRCVNVKVLPSILNSYTS